MTALNPSIGVKTYPHSPRPFSVRPLPGFRWSWRGLRRLPELLFWEALTSPEGRESLVPLAAGVSLSAAMFSSVATSVMVDGREKCSYRVVLFLAAWRTRFSMRASGASRCGPGGGGSYHSGGVYPRSSRRYVMYSYNFAYDSGFVNSSYFSLLLVE